MNNRKTKSQELSAAKAGISERSARRIDGAAALPSQTPRRYWRSRVDPFAAVWDSEIVPLLKGAPNLMAITLLRKLQDDHPEDYPDGVLRTLQRHVRQWRALEGPQNALWALGGVPEEHRTDSLSAAFNNLAEAETLTRRYEDLCRHYGLRPSRNNLGQSHENGAIESRQGSLKGALEQALLLRGHREFATTADYQRFVAEVVTRLNRRIQTRLAEDRSQLAALPMRRTSEYEEIEARVTKFSTVSIRRVLYSVPSRLIGHRLQFRLYPERLEGWLGGVCVFESVRGAVPAGKRRGKQLDYRHLLPALKRKPGAFARWALRDDMFPRAEYRQTWERLVETLPERQACKLMVGLLDLAARGACEVQLAQLLGGLLQAGTLPDLEGLEARFAPRQTPMPAVTVSLPALSVYDGLYEVAV
jgi:hypothetical protein